MYLSYSGYQCASGCLYHYWHSYIGKTQGSPEDALGSVYGTIVGRLFESFYNERMWFEPGSKDKLAARVAALVEKVLDEEQKPKKGRPAGVLLWREGLYLNKEDLISDVHAAIPRGLATIKHYRLLGVDVKAELKLDSDIEGHRIGGRADFVMKRMPPHRDLVLVDGKGSRRRDKYVDVLQLQWYSLLYRERFGRLPDKTAFVYWHFDPPTNIDWCTFEEPLIDKLKTDLIKFINDLEARAQKVGDSKSLPVVKSVFPASAKVGNCLFCPYATLLICPEGHAVVTKWQETQRTKK